MTELKSMKIILDNEEEFEEDLLDPSQEDSTEYGEIPQKIRAGEPIIPNGHGWAFAPAKDKGDNK